MEPIRLVWGTGTGPTPLAAYDGALADANVHEYNLLTLSSVIPADATIERVGTAPALGPIGAQLAVVEAGTTTQSGPISAAVGWARREDGSGIFYEAADTAPTEAVTDHVITGLDSGIERRAGTFTEPTVQTASTVADDTTERYASVAVLAVYGTGSHPLSAANR
jgi:arginine decarboxylase